MTVQPNSKFTMKMPIASALCRPMSTGKKYSRIEKIRKNIFAPLRHQLGLRQAQQLPPKKQYAAESPFVPVAQPRPTVRRILPAFGLVAAAYATLRASRFRGM